MNDLKQLAMTFLKDCAEGRATAAFKDHAAPGFKHHNLYFPGDAASLARGMNDNARAFPHKSFEPQRALQDGDLVAVHSKVTMNDMVITVVHIFRFSNGKIAELWDIGLPVPADCPNEHGAF